MAGADTKPAAWPAAGARARAEAGAGAVEGGGSITEGEGLLDSVVTPELFYRDRLGTNFDRRQGSGQSQG